MEDAAALADQVFELKKEILAHEVERNLLKSNFNQLQGQLKRRVRYRESDVMQNIILHPVCST